MLISWSEEDQAYIVSVPELPYWMYGRRKDTRRSGKKKRKPLLNCGLKPPYGRWRNNTRATFI